LYVNEILIFGTSLDVINEVKTFLCQSFDMKDIGEADVILNIKLIKGENVITLAQFHYVEKVLRRFGYKDSKPSPTPYDPSLVLQKNKRIGRDQLRYSQTIGSLMYLASAMSYPVLMPKPSTHRMHDQDQMFHTYGKRVHRKPNVII
jgi:hypothetical protein